jgi:histidinol dehydrogenase
LQSIRQRGDAAIFEWTARIDELELTELAIAPTEIRAALNRIPPETRTALELSAHRIRHFHQKQRTRLQDWQEDGLGQKITPIEKIGVYVPGGTAPLPSSLLMSAIPAQAADVKEIIVCTPPSREDGHVPDIILAAAAVCGIEKVFRVGGAQAIGAMAYGTTQIPRVDKIVGPGNLFVTLAKRQIYGIVGIDGLPGPTETMIIADENANPAWVASDMLAQAEHDVLASAILVTPSRALAQSVTQAAAAQLENLTRTEIIEQSLQNTSGIVLVDTLEAAFPVANAYAAEHLCLAIENPSTWLGHVQNAGGVFLGENSFEVLGDYIAGPSHVMPTGGTARFASPLNVLDFIKVISIIGLDAMTAQTLSVSAARLAYAEELTAHAAAAEMRVRSPQT